ncbi:MAG: rhomboid family GlyGly-CTERM serine protease [Lentimonas sp.]|jgi:rhomboid family GlyGly-CTERM serine protease
MNNIFNIINRGKFPWLTLIFNFIIVALFFIPDDLFAILIFNQDQMNSGNHIGFLTSHFLHVDVEHLVLNIMAFLALGYVLENHGKKYLIAAVIAGVIGVDVFLLIFSNLKFYCGFSGVLNSLLIFAITSIYRKGQNNNIVFLILIGSLGKIIFEIYFGSALSDVSWRSEPKAHLSGFLSAIIFLTFYKVINQNRSQGFGI